MRKTVTKERLRQFMRGLAKRASGSGSIFLTGGATALLLGLRDQTIDIDLKLDPEPHGAFEAIAALKEELDVNVELASPGDFIPLPSGWRDRSIPIESFGGIQFFHFDPVSQALAKIERAYDQDTFDAGALVEKRLVTVQQLREAFEEIRPKLVRYPALDAGAFEKKLEDFVRHMTAAESDDRE